MTITQIRMNLETDQMRYDTYGDWQVANDVLSVEVDKNCGTADQRFLVALHELVESYLCEKRGITTEQVDQWDMEHEGQDGEPGEIVGAPYFREHAFACLIENQVAFELGVKPV